MSIGDDSATSAPQTMPQPVLRIGGNPTDAETAAVIVALSPLAGAGAPPARESVPSRWNDPVRNMRLSWLPRPGAWPATSWRRR